MWLILGMAASSQSLPIQPFALEQFFAQHEFTAKHLLCCSDSETFMMKELLALADEESRALWDDLTLGYTETAGLPQLRQEIVKRIYPRLSPEHVMCFAGAEEAIYCCMRTLLSPADHAIVITPCYQSLRSIAETVCPVTSVDLIENKGSWSIDWKALENAFQGNTKLLICNFPHNPTGALLTHEEQSRLIDLCRAHNVYLFFDEVMSPSRKTVLREFLNHSFRVYRGLERDPSNRLIPTAQLYNKGISLGVMSKALGLAGLRVGWLASQDLTVLKQAADYKHYLSICNSAPSEVLSLIGMRSFDKLLERNNTIADANLALIDSFLTRLLPTFFQATLVQLLTH